MKNLLTLLLLGTMVLSAQTAKPKPRPCTSTIPESVPHNAVEPARDDHQQAWCPRSEYELQWYVVEDQQIYYNPGGISYTGISVNPTTKTVLVFKPMCVPKEGQ